MDRNFTAAGYIEPEPPYPVQVTPLVRGRLELFEVLEGMPVEAGQVIAQADSTALERQAEVLQAERRRLSEELAGVQWQVDNTRIRAPVAGVVFERLAHSGQWVGAGHLSAIASIYDPRRLQVWVDVNQRDAGRVRVGQRVEIRLDAEPGRTFPGRVTRVLPRASIAKNTFEAKITLEESASALRPDMTVNVTFLRATDGSVPAEGGQSP
jgi:multidrug resistance efflux pump